MAMGMGRREGEYFKYVYNVEASEPGSINTLANRGERGVKNGL